MDHNVCFLVSEHPFLDARIFKKEAKSLHQQGYQVTMIVPRKKGYLFDVDGSIFYEQFRSSVFGHEGINVITYEQRHPEKRIKELNHNLQSGHHHRFTDQLTQLGIEQKADYYHAHEFFSLYSGIGIKRALAVEGKQTKLIYDSHELDPDPLIEQPQNIYNTKKQMLKLMLNELDYVITVSSSIKSWYRSINPYLPTEVIYNAPPLTPDHHPGQGYKKGLTIAYEGVMNQNRGSFHKLIDILEQCHKTLRLNLIIIGGEKAADQDLKHLIPPHLQENVHFTGWIGYDAIPSVMKGADLGWIDLDTAHSLNQRFAMPNKFFSYLNNGVPVLANQSKDMQTFVETYQCGHVVPKQQATADDYVQALHFLDANRDKIRTMSLNARQAMEAHFSWEHMAKRLYAVYDRLAKDRS
ncbi:glycosyltransferase [Lentibacillus salinarum]|uniref:Glycosyltransferase n=1 Tax=Lentibacillus salinarum TaxID=446820 RepID=A0ABW3ZS23_9BACI